MNMKTIFSTAAIAVAAAGLSACGPSFSTQMMALCTNPPGGPNGPGLVGNRDCTCTVAALDAGLSSEEKSLLLAGAVVADRRQSAAAREQARATLRAAGIDVMRGPTSGTPAAAFAEHMEDLSRDIRRNCPRAAS
jgi:hypothetical protein